MRRGLACIVGFCAALAACATQVSGVSTPAGSGQIPSGPIDLGAWRTSSQAASFREFQRSITNRYSVGLAISAVAADVRRSRFNCSDPPRDLADNRATPPVFVCRRTITEQGCTHTWQVHLFDNMNNRRLSRTRALYDRRCGSDGLLGGP